MKGNVKKPLFLAAKRPWSSSDGAEEERGLAGCLPLPETHFGWETSAAVRQLSVSSREQPERLERRDPNPGSFRKRNVPRKRSRVGRSPRLRGQHLEPPGAGLGCAVHHSLAL